MVATHRLFNNILARSLVVKVALTLFSFSLFLSPLAVPLTYAQTGDTASIAGDEVCGSWDGKKIVNPCGLKEIGVVAKRVLTYVIVLGLPILICVIAIRFLLAWKALQEGNAGAYKDALKKSGESILGFLFIVAIFGGLLFVFLKYLTVGDEYLKILKLFSDAFISSASAQGTPSQLPNPVGVNSLYDFLMAGLSLIMRFFVYPAMIAIWVITGFSFVAAQGNPDKLNKAKQWLMGAFITTLVIFMVQMFVLALRGTVEKILSQESGTLIVEKTVEEPTRYV